MADPYRSGDLIIEGARQNNLKNIHLRIPHNAVTVITGVSGSGKSSLAFDTLFAEGQWRYVESLSTYTRMFLERVSRPDVDRLINIRPAIAIEQKNPVRTARSTVGTVTEIADHLRLLFAKLGKLMCPDCHLQAQAFHPQTVADDLLKRCAQARAMILFPIAAPASGQEAMLIASLRKRGYVRLLSGDNLIDLNDESRLSLAADQPLHVVLDRLVLRLDNRSRLTESVETAFQEGGGLCRVNVIGQGALVYSVDLRCPGCGRPFEPIRPVGFSFNHPLGACPACKGFGNILRYDEDRVVPDRNRSLADGAVEPWTKPGREWWQRKMLGAMKRRNISVTKPYARLSAQARTLLWRGAHDFEGIQSFFESLEQKRYKLHVRVFLSRYRNPFPCEACEGSRLRANARYVKINGRDIHDVCQLTIREIETWLASLQLSEFEADLAQDILRPLRAKLGFLLRMGLDYLTLNRESRTLSGGEAQRIALCNQLGARLVGTLYVLDEPTIGLHARDTATLASILQDLAGHGNTVVVVEHDRHVMEQADYVVELGPWSGEKGGEVVCAAPQDTFVRDRRSLTARYLRGDDMIPCPRKRRPGNGQFLIVTGASARNLKNLTVRFPLGMLICVTGVSGSGKSTLVEETLYRSAAQAFDLGSFPPGHVETVEGLEALRTVRLIDQEPIGRTPRSNPITYIKGYDEIRRLFAVLPEAQRRGLTASHFSFNTRDGRCERCQGNGYEKLEMYFFDDLYVTCEDCQGRRFRTDVLAVRWRGLSIHDVLNMTVHDVLGSFSQASKFLHNTLQLLDSLGLGYLRLGQPATSLSGGEAQRLKIAAELISLRLWGRDVIHQGDEGGEKTSLDRQVGRSVVRTHGLGKQSRAQGVLYILDEPTTGLHMEDIKKLLTVLASLVDAGNTVVVVEHHLDVIKTADWIIDLGPEGGAQGGHIVAKGRPEQVARVSRSHTASYLRPLLSGSHET